MRNKKISIIFGFTILTILMNPMFVIGATATVSTIADKDTYIETYSGGSNYGGGNYLWAGISILDTLYEAYLHFSFSDKPVNHTKAEISLNIFGVSKTTIFDICIIEASWEELTLTWINRPAKGELITQLTVASDKTYKIDISSYIEGRTDISICVYTGDYAMDDYVYIKSRESHSQYAPENDPQLIWTYEAEATIGGFDLVIFFGVMVGVVIILIKKRTKKRIY